MGIGVGEVPERPKGTDCKSVGDAFGGSNPPLSTRFTLEIHGMEDENLSPTGGGELRFGDPDGVGGGGESEGIEHILPSPPGLL